jgi:hypothetical protein
MGPKYSRSKGQHRPSRRLVDGLVKSQDNRWRVHQKQNQVRSADMPR